MLPAVCSFILRLASLLVPVARQPIALPARARISPR